ncbi:MAG: hypothetical protein KGZ74_17680 [Chitinophagaceae bacterium]|jgi:hypothetical protein|nr:hypothetical protein [Chitinophagaceae bacterium]
MLSVILADYAGSEKDVYFLQNAEWLNDSTVIQYIYQQKGRWKVTLAFAWNENPMQIICRYMKDEYATEQKAATYASFFCRTTQKGGNSYSTINYDDFNICFN